MAAPTITTVLPATGPTGGSTLVEIQGTNFQLAPTPPATGTTTAPNPSVEVLFGTRKGTQVAVISTTRLLVVSPIHDAGLVDITVRNVDQSGAIVGAETTTIADAYTFALPQLDGESDLQRITRTLLRELKRQVIGEVVLTSHVDWDDDPSDLLDSIAITKLPSLLLTGPDLRENRFYSLNAARYANRGGGAFDRMRTPITVDLIFEITGFDDRTARLLNLMALVESFVQRNDYIYMPRDGSAPDGEMVRYEFDFEPGGHMQITSAPSSSNIRQFSGTVSIRGFDIDEADMVIAKTQELVDTTPLGSVNPPFAVILDGQAGIPTASGGVGGQGGGEPIYQLPPED